MKTFSHLCQYLAKFFLEWKMIQTKVIEKIKTHILYSITFFRKYCRLRDNVETLGGVRGATDDVTIRRIRVACWISKTISTHRHAHAHAPGHPHVRMRTQTNMQYLLLFHGSNITLYVHCLSCYSLYVTYSQYTVSKKSISPSPPKLCMYSYTLG